MKCWLTFFTCLLAAQNALGCATVTAVFDDINGQLGTSGGASIQQESAVIIWDDQKHIEHFIRIASFKSHAPSLGFLVPTPDVPELVEVDPAILDMAHEMIAPRPVAPRKNLNLLSHAAKCLLGFAAFDLGIDTTTVFEAINSQILADALKEQDVAGYHATVLDAQTVQQLKNWLLQNKFVWSEDDAAWLEPYIRKHWKITAFHLINPNPDQDGFKTRLFRMSFHAQRPFFPYSEPENKRAIDDIKKEYRELNISFIGNDLVSGKLEDGSVWPGKLEFAGSSTPDETLTPKWKASQWLSLAKLDPSMSLPAYLTTYVDRSSPRHGTSDLIFDSDKRPDPYRATKTDFSLPVSYSWQPLDILGILFAALVSGSFFYTAIRCWHVSKRSAGKPASTQYPDRAFSKAADRFLPVLCLIFGFFFSLGLIFLPLPFFCRAYSVVRNGAFVGNEPGTPLFKILPPRVCSLVLICCAILYLFLFIQHIGWGETSY